MSSFAPASSWTYHFNANVPQAVQDAFNRGAILWSGAFADVEQNVSIGQGSQGDGVEIRLVSTLNGNWGEAYNPGSSHCPNGCIEIAEDWLNSGPSWEELSWLGLHEPGHILNYDDNYDPWCATDTIMYGYGGATAWPWFTDDDECWLYMAYLWTPPGELPVAPAPAPMTSSSTGLASRPALTALALGVVMFGSAIVGRRRVRRSMDTAPLTVLGILLLGGIMLAQGTGAQETQRKPVVQGQRVFVTPPSPPKNWDDAVLKSDLVAHVILRTRAHVTGPDNVPADRYDADVIESIKQDARIYNQPRLIILRAGGMVETPTALVKQNIGGFPDWSLDRQYIMFLRFNPIVNAWNPRFGPDAVFEVRLDGQTVQTQCRSQFARAQHERPLATVLSEVRAAEVRMRGRGGGL